MGNQFTPVSALLGGALIGLSATLLMALVGRVAGISGVLNGLLPPTAPDRSWRLAFLLGLPAGAALVALAADAPLPVSGAGWGMVLLAGLLVGFGTRLGNGCTSGHGVCGLARLSSRSLAAVLTFLLVAVATTFVARHLLGVVT